MNEIPVICDRCGKVLGHVFKGRMMRIWETRLQNLLLDHEPYCEGEKVDDKV